MSREILGTPWPPWGRARHASFSLGIMYPGVDSWGTPYLVMLSPPSFRPPGFFPSTPKSHEEADTSTRGFPYLVAWDSVFPSSEGLRLLAGRMLPPLPVPPACSGQDIL